LLTSEQRKLYEEIAPARAGSGQQATSGRVWVLDDSGRPRPVSIRVGLADGSYSELLGGELQAGTPVIVGTRTDGKAARVQPKGGPRFGF
jgi:HlyD family secretion protein